MDVRRARERILYEDYLKMLGSGSSVSQQLLFPERLVLPDSEYAPVSYTHLDVYKRQADKRENRGAEHRDLRPAQLVEGRLRFDAGRQQAGFETLHGLVTVLS